MIVYDIMTIVYLYNVIIYQEMIVYDIMTIVYLYNVIIYQKIALYCYDDIRVWYTIYVFCFLCHDTAGSDDFPRFHS